jgi:hypothetical protein
MAKALTQSPEGVGPLAEVRRAKRSVRLRCRMGSTFNSEGSLGPTGSAGSNPEGGDPWGIRRCCPRMVSGLT